MFGRKGKRIAELEAVLQPLVRAAEQATVKLREQEETITEMTATRKRWQKQLTEQDRLITMLDDTIEAMAAEKAELQAQVDELAAALALALDQDDDDWSSEAFDPTEVPFA